MKRKILVLDAYTNGHDAALKFIRKQKWRKKDCNIVFCGSHPALLKQLTEGPAFAVVPVRNSIVGEVAEVTKELGRLAELGYIFEKLAELPMQISHCLVAQPSIKFIHEVQRVLSHEKAIQQCGKFLDKLGITPDRRNKRDSTGNAAKTVAHSSSDSKIAAIASRSAARAYKLKILATDIQDTLDNRTTFFLLENKCIVETVTVGIIGIDGRFGRMLQAFFEKLGCKVIGSDVRLPETNNIDVVKNSEVVIFSVPIKETPLVIESVRPHIRKNQLLMDVTSVKGPAVRAMMKTKAQVVGLHPMFAPETGFDGQTTVVCPERLTEPRWKTWVMNVLATTGSKLKWSNPKEHDTYMATVQVSPHLANLVGAVLIMEMGVSTDESLTFTSPFYRIMFSLMGRFLSQDPDLYSAIIMKNAASIPMVKRRIEIEKRILKMIRNYDRDGFRELFKKARDHFGKDVTREANQLFLRIIAVMKTLYGKNSVIIEFNKKANKPGLLEKILRVFRRRGVNLTGINFVGLDDEHQQFTLSLAESKTSDAVRKALEELERWDSPKIRVISA